ncbi:hypothetical protein QUF94_01500 [Peribacillus sp. NJ4]|uniref:hypothetical protein n=1 Tax=Peribacillus TaxID=2675229 RepID=UPI0025A00030|nr:MULTISPECIES: hypothetical protein [unclassified Peribacillus]MDM5210144.1 hypothetical protein [Peribacillus sp. NJ4]MDM5220429.1 hypothetical protein [Peribacillus sp. NJ11]
MAERPHYNKFGLRKKLVFFITAQALIVNSSLPCSNFLLPPILFEKMSSLSFSVGTLILGILGSGVLAFFAAVVQGHFKFGSNYSS